jgi:predicted GIY-YIG superfamily endonuclease
MSVWSVYIATNKVNAKQYVGITKDIKRRWRQHASANGSAPAFHAAIQKYGPENFVFSHVCDAFDFECACEIEKMFIQQHNTQSPNGYNLTHGGDGVGGRPMSDEGKNVRRTASLAFSSSLTKEQRSNLFGHSKGKKLTFEHIEKIRVSNKGRNLGKKASEETRAKMSVVRKGKPRKPLNEETKEKIRQSLLGRKMPESEKKKHASFTGRNHTEETKEKIKNSNVATKALLKAKKITEEGVKNV